MLFGAAVAIALVVPLGAYAFVKSGIYNVAASHPHTTFTQWITHDTMIHSVRRNAASISAPSAYSAKEVVAGFCAYEAHCVACHGAPQIARERWVSGMEPSPPYLLDATSKWTAPQIFWIAKNGIKMTGMPSWRNSMSDRELWNLVGFIEAMREMPPNAYSRWRSERRCGG
jgi:mono/diheme cytochrome c family protein